MNFLLCEHPELKTGQYCAVEFSANCQVFIIRLVMEGFLNISNTDSKTHVDAIPMVFA